MLGGEVGSSALLHPEERAHRERVVHLGCGLPPSVRRMFEQLGGVCWGSEETLAAGEIAARLPQLREVIATGCSG